jgi:hypothetical protein
LGVLDHGLHRIRSLLAHHIPDLRHQVILRRGMSENQGDYGDRQNDQRRKRQDGIESQGRSEARSIMLFPRGERSQKARADRFIIHTAVLQDVPAFTDRQVKNLSFLPGQVSNETYNVGQISGATPLAWHVLLHSQTGASYDK